MRSPRLAWTLERVRGAFDAVTDRFLRTRDFLRCVFRERYVAGQHHDRMSIEVEQRLQVGAPRLPVRIVEHAQC